MYEFVTNNAYGAQGDVKPLTKGVADILLQRGIVKPVAEKKRVSAPRPKKSARRKTPATDSEQSKD